MNRKSSDDTALLARIRAAVALGTQPIAPDGGEQLPDEGNGLRATHARSAAICGDRPMSSMAE